MARIFKVTRILVSDNANQGTEKTMLLNSDCLIKAEPAGPDKAGAATKLTYRGSLSMQLELIYCREPIEDIGIQVCEKKDE